MDPRSAYGSTSKGKGERRAGGNEPGEAGRRGFLGLLVAGGAALVLPSACHGPARERTGLLRPPGAQPEARFLALCARCGSCAAACPVGCILPCDTRCAAGTAWTPFIDPRERGCILCMRCQAACPTGALRQLSPDRATQREAVHMGLVHIDTLRCLAYNRGGICRACYYACPFPQEAILLGRNALEPRVDARLCVGCGLCAEVCPEQAVVIDRC